MKAKSRVRSTKPRLAQKHAKRAKSAFEQHAGARLDAALRAPNSADDLSGREVYRRALGQCPSISMHPRRQQGLPCIAGTRIPVHLVIWAVEQSGSIDGALKSYPDLSRQQVKDALYFAESILGSPDVITEAAPTA